MNQKTKSAQRSIILKVENGSELSYMADGAMICEATDMFQVQAIYDLLSQAKDSTLRRYVARAIAATWEGFASAVLAMYGGQYSKADIAVGLCIHYYAPELDLWEPFGDQDIKVWMEAYIRKLESEAV